MTAKGKAGIVVAALAAMFAAQVLLVSKTGEEIDRKKAAEAQESAADCACVYGKECRGPDGGRYCMTVDGKKKYMHR